MSKKAQGGPVYFVFGILLFVLLWFTWLGGFIGDIGEQIVVSNGYTGVEAFFYANLNIVIFVVLVLAIMTYGFFAGR